MKVSYSICAAWWKGDKDGAIKSLNGEEVVFPRNQELAMSFGKGFHKAMELESNITKKLPAIFNMPDFDVVGTEVKLYKKLDDDWISGVIDAVAIGKINNKEVALLVDYKTGKPSDDWQSAVYHFLVKDSQWWFENMKGLEPTHFMYMTLDKLDDRARVDSIIKLTYPTNQREWDAPEATTYTRGYNWLSTVIEDIKNELGIM